MASISSTTDLMEERDWDYRREGYQPDISPKRDGYLPTVERLEEGVRRDSLEGRITLVGQDLKRATYDIDGCIRATVPADSFRAMAASHWEEMKSFHKTRAWVSVALTVCGVGAAITYSPWIAVAAIASAVYAAVQFSKMGEASTQISGWREDPAKKLAFERKKAYEQGFIYAYHKDFKLGERSRHAVLLPFEVEHLFNRYYDQTCMKLSAQRCTTDRQKKAWLDQFRLENPISERVLRYVYGVVPPDYAPISQNFEVVANSLKDIEAEFHNVRAQRRAESEQTISSIETQRTLASAIPNAALSYKLSQARDIRDRKIREYGEAYRREAEREYESSRAQYYGFYAAALLPINIYFDGKVKEARDALASILNVIAQQEANAFSPYYDYAQEVVSATAAARNKGYVYRQPAFNPAQNLQIPNFPKIEINFVYQTPPGIDPGFWSH